MKKSIFLFIIAILFALTTSSQTPQAFKYQAVARDLSGSVLVSKNVSFRISILQSSASGTSVYSENHTKTTNAFGLVDLEIGNGSSPTGNFSAINWANNSYFLKVELDPNGGSAYQLMGTSQLLSVPYAIQSKKTEEVADNSVTAAKIANNAVTVAKLPAGATATTYLRGDGTWQTPAGGSTTPYGNDGDIQFKNGTNFFASQLLHWDNTNYRLGIGTNSPDSKLQVVSNSTVTSPQIKLFETEADYARINFHNSSSTSYWALAGLNSTTNANERFNIYNSTSGDVFSISGTGNVGIGNVPIVNYRLRVVQNGSGNYGALDLENSGAYATLKVSNTSTTGKAAYFDGLVQIVGDKGELNLPHTGTANVLPFAYGFITNTGAKSSVTSNIGTITKVGTGNYKIEIDGLGTDYIVTATLNQGNAYYLTSVTSRTSLFFVVSVWDTKNDVYADGAFSFVVYKP